MLPGCARNALVHGLAEIFRSTNNFVFFILQMLKMR